MTIQDYFQNSGLLCPKSEALTGKWNPPPVTKVLA
jgi:hypothetical protein